jgi:hypothetical protein
MKNSPITAVMISLNESKNMKRVCENLVGWVDQIFLLDSYSSDDTVDIALSYGVNVYQRKFDGFGNQWNFALNNLPIKNPWIMKIDPDETISDELKKNISYIIEQNKYDGIEFYRRLWFIGKPINIKQKITRIWKRGKCKFIGENINEYPQINGAIVTAKGYMEHFDSYSLHHWIDKQNNYSSLEAIDLYNNYKNVTTLDFFNYRKRKSFIKKYFFKVPFRYAILFLYNYIIKGACLSGKPGYIWSKLRCQVYKFREYKFKEMEIKSELLIPIKNKEGFPDKRVKQF